MEFDIIVDRCYYDYRKGTTDRRLAAIISY